MWLGVDVGTTSVKVCCLDEEEKVVWEGQERPNAATEETGVQKAQPILDTALKLIRQAVETVGPPSRIAVSGQMHGVVLWRQGSVGEGDVQCSPLYNWMYDGVPKDFVRRLPKWSLDGLHPGFGRVTLAWLAEKEEAHCFDSCGTIMDLLLVVLSSQPVPLSTHNAHSWGYAEGREWQADTCGLMPGGVRLPRIADAGERCMRVSVDWMEGAGLSPAIGDLQATVYPHVHEGLAVVNIGTSSQLCVLVPVDLDVETDRLVKERGLAVIPFTGDRHLLVAASMNGGNAVDTLLQRIVSWSSVLSGISSPPIDYPSLFERVDALAREQGNVACVSPLFISERGGRAAGACIEGLTGETTVDQMVLATCRGVARNLFDMCPMELLLRLGVSRLLLLGSAGQPRFATGIPQHPAVSVSRGPSHLSAAHGAALFAKRAIDKHIVH